MILSDKINPDLMPNFLFIGAGKSGSTSLDQYLKQHPQIFMPIKEVGFFALEGQKKVDPKDDPEMMYHFPNGITNLVDYENLFKEAGKNQLRGETSPIYLYNEDAPIRIKKYVPDVKLIAILRQPIDRLYSRYMHLANEGRQPTENFEDAMDRKSIWWRKNDLVKEGFYFLNLSRYYELFPPEQIKIFLYEDFQKNPQTVLNEIFSFLNVSNDFHPNTNVRYNENGFIKNRLFDGFFGKNGVLLKTVKVITPNLYERAKNSSTIRNSLNKIRNVNLKRPPLSKAVRIKATHEIYKEDIQNLQDLISRDLSHWLVK